jgi:hypothetical protein
MSPGGKTNGNQQDKNPGKTEAARERTVFIEDGEKTCGDETCEEVVGPLLKVLMAPTFLSHQPKVMCSIPGTDSGR